MQEISSSAHQTNIHREFTSRREHPVKPSRRTTRLLWGATVFLALIGLGAVTRRVVVLIPTLRTGYQPPVSAIDSGFARYPILTLIHILPGALFMVLGPLQFVPRLRSHHPKFHRWSGRVFLILGAVIGISALIMSFQTTIGGANETAATTLFAFIFLFSLGKAYIHIRRREFAQHREWMIRAFAIGLAVATIRPIVGIFFALSRITHQTPHEFFGTAFWLGFTIQLLVAEIWINVTRPQLTTFRENRAR